MTAKDFFRILGQVKGMEWTIEAMPISQFGASSRTRFIKGERHMFYYSPLSAVASAVRRRYLQVGDKSLTSTLNLHPRTHRRIEDAIYQAPGYSMTVRRKLLKACRLKWCGPTS